MDRVELNRLRWHCRRGMLENDLVLERFMDRHGETLEGDSLEGFRRLLEHADGDLWDLICGRATSTDPYVTKILPLLNEAARSMN
jgi:succinate dehydrogenase flavin-adding protein (antitoxin of CptAB toxin-antitoxin module)